jgi:mRNA-degrading endonuclease HigB of HigAB toxin-antitoxin module
MELIKSMIETIRKKYFKNPKNIKRKINNKKRK